MPFPPHDRTPDLHTWLTDSKARTRSERDAAATQPTDTSEFLSGRVDCQTFTLDELDQGVTADDIMGLVDQSVTDYIASADSLQRVKGYASMAADIYDFL